MLTALDDAEQPHAGVPRRGQRLRHQAVRRRGPLRARSPPPAPGRPTWTQAKVQGEIHVELQQRDRPPPGGQRLPDSASASRHPLSAEQIVQLRQAVMEMGQNAIEWGNRHRRRGAGARSPTGSTTTGSRSSIRDQGPGFDPGELPHAAAAGRPDRPPGRPREARPPRGRVRAADLPRDGRRAAV